MARSVRAESPNDAVVSEESEVENLDEQELTEEDKRLLEDWRTRWPLRVFRYVGLSGDRRKHLASVRDSNLYFPQYSDLNDPFDGACHMDLSAPADAIRTFLERQFPDDPNLEQRIGLSIRTASDPKAQEHIARGFREYTSRHGVSCFTETPDDLLMWSYYAEGHAGLCLRFRTEPLYDSVLKHRGIFLQVDYSHEYPRTCIYTDGAPTMGHRVLGTKAQQWRHEKEWRFVLWRHSGLVHFAPEALDGIILGCKMSPKDEHFVCDLARARGGIQILRDCQRKAEYGLDIVDLT